MITSNAYGTSFNEWVIPEYPSGGDPSANEISWTMYEDKKGVPGKILKVGYVSPSDEYPIINPSSKDLTWTFYANNQGLPARVLKSWTPSLAEGYPEMKTGEEDGTWDFEDDQGENEEGENILHGEKELRDLYFWLVFDAGGAWESEAIYINVLC